MVIRMSLLVIELAREGSDFFPNDLKKAEDLFGDLIEKTGANRMLVLRSDSSDEMPMGISDLSKKKGIDSDCLQVDRLMPNNWSGDEDPDEIWCEHLEKTIVNSGISNQDAETMALLMNAGSNWSSSLLFVLAEIIGCSLWVTEGGAKSANTAIEMGQVLSGDSSEVVLARLADLNMEGQDWCSSKDLQGFPSMPKPKGIVNALGNALESELVEKRKYQGRTEYRLTTLGRYHAMLALAKFDMLGKVKGSGRCLILFIRSSENPEDLISYLKEHRKEFDYYAFIVGGIESSNEEQLSIEIHQMAHDLLGEDRVISSPKDVCFSIPNSGGLLESSSEVMRIIHNIRKQNKGIEWTLEVGKILSVLRPAIYQYSLLAEMSRVFFARQYPTDGVRQSYLRGSMHTLMLPHRSQIEAVRKVINHDGASRFVGTAWLWNEKKPGTIMTITKVDGVYPFYEFNINEFQSVNRLRFSVSSAPANLLKRGLKDAFDCGAIELDRLVDSTPSGAVSFDDVFSLTPIGLISGSILYNNRS